MERIRVLRIIARLNIGGPAIHAVLLTKNLDNERFESKLLCGSISDKEGDMNYILKPYNVKPVYIPNLKREISPIHDFITCYRLFKLMKKYRPHIVHTHTAKAGALGRVAAVLAGVPVKVHTFHGNIFYGYFGNITTRIFIVIERILARFSDAVIVISPHQKVDITEKYRIATPAKCRITRLGFDLEKFLNSGKRKNILRQKFNFREDDILVGIIGRLIPIKNHKMFIDAAEYIKTKITDFDKNMTDRIKFVIIGDGELKDDLALYAGSKGLKNQIFFTGWVRDIEGAYSDIDIVALTSLNEGTPVSLIEAMASSKPVISTDVGGVRDVVTDIGLLVASGDYRAMGDGILRLCLSPEKRKDFGDRGREYVRHLYSKERLVKELEILYNELVAKKLGKEK